MRRTIHASTLLALLMASAAFGQAQKGAITVTVVSDDGNPLPGATVAAESDQTLTRRMGIADAQGRVALVGLAPAANYMVTTSLDGFNGARNENVQVRAGQDLPIRMVLHSFTVTDQLTVTGEPPIIDLTSALAGQEITLQLTESLPTGRSYQDYLQIVPGVMPAIDRGQGFNPASRSGLNYRNIGGEVGVSRDNFYYIEGINVTDPVEGLTQTSLNTEIIQEQSVLTGGLPAEFVGASGLVSNVITKSGGNRLSGSVNYYLQNDSLVESNDHFEDQTFDTFDAAVTLGGPFVRDKAWFFASFRNVNRKDDVVSPDGGLLRRVERDEEQGFAKITWSPTSKDLLTGVFLSDPTDVSGQRNNTRSNARDFSEERGAERFTLGYSRVFSSASLDLAFSDHEGDLDRLSAIQRSENDVLFRIGDSFTQAEEQLGGAGFNNFETRGTERIRGALEVLFATSWGDHSVKGGVELSESTDFRDRNLIDGESYTSISLRYLDAGVTAREVSEGGFSGFGFFPADPITYTRFMESINSHARRDEFFALLDRGCSAPGCEGVAGDGVITPDELADNLVFDGTAGNPDGQINYERLVTLRPGAGTTETEGRVVYLQDTWQWKRWSVNAGVRAEEWEHLADTGQKVFTFDWEYAPRISVAYDLGGDGRQLLSLYYGRYYDPIRHNATIFVGSLIGREDQWQVYVAALGEWVGFLTRGGTRQLEETFAPNTKTPYTDEWQLGYKRDLGRNMSLEVNLIKRETRDIVEDYDFPLYADPRSYPGPLDHPDSLFLGPEFFGFPTRPTSRFNIMTLPPDSFRDWEGVELIFRKRYSNRWQMLASYNYADAEGNTNSDSNFDLAGDDLRVDPRAPNLKGTQPGLIQHLFKVAASYNWDNGLQLGGTYRWNSGAIVNITQRVFGRHLPVLVAPADAFDFAGITTRWVRPDAVGGLESPSYGVLDLRLAYLWSITGRLEVDVFVDIFNVLDDQKPVQVQDLESGGAGFEFNEGTRFVDPRRYFLGARLRF